MNSETPIVDAAKEARFRYTSQWSDEDKAKMLTASQEEQMEWVKNCPPDGWEIARRLEIRNRRLDECGDAQETMEQIHRMALSLRLAVDDGTVALHDKLTKAEAEVAELMKQAPATNQDDSLIAAIEGDRSKMAHADLVLTCKMLENGRAIWRKEAEEAQQQLTQLQQDVRPLLQIVEENTNHCANAVRASKVLETFLAKHPSLKP